MPSYRVFWTARGLVEVEADNEEAAESKAWGVLRDLKGPGLEFDDREIHCADEV